MQLADKEKEIRNKINALSEVPENIDWNVWRRIVQLDIIEHAMGC